MQVPGEGVGRRTRLRPLVRSPAPVLTGLRGERADDLESSALHVTPRGLDHTSLCDHGQEPDSVLLLPGSLRSLLGSIKRSPGHGAPRDLLQPCRARRLPPGPGTDSPPPGNDGYPNGQSCAWRGHVAGSSSSRKPSARVCYGTPGVLISSTAKYDVISRF